jgi:hypothetical protein
MTPFNTAGKSAAVAPSAFWGKTLKASFWQDNLLSAPPSRHRGFALLGNSGQR